MSGTDLLDTMVASSFCQLYFSGQRRAFPSINRVASSIPVYKLMYPRSYDLLDQVVNLIEQTERYRSSCGDRLSGSSPALG
jgi:hypothetical protein